MSKTIDGVTIPTEQLGPICPHCKTLPALHYSVIDDEASNGEIFKITYCEDCKVAFNVQYVGRRPPQAQRPPLIHRAGVNPTVDLKKLPQNLMNRRKQ